MSPQKRERCRSGTCWSTHFRREGESSVPSSPEPKRNERIVALIPALNAEDTIAGIVRGCVPHVAEVVVVDDGSSDETGARAAEAGATVLRHPVNKRKGAALKTGF